METDDFGWQKPKKKKRRSQRKKKTEEASVAESDTTAEEIVFAEPIAEAVPIVEAITFGETNWEKESRYVKKFFTKSSIGEAPTGNYKAMYIWGGFLLILGIIVVVGGVDTINGVCVLTGFVLASLGAVIIINGSNILKAKKKYRQKLREWHALNPNPLFSRLMAVEKLVASSSYQNLGINKDAKPNEGGIVRPPAYCYGPHFSFDDFSRIDKTGWGKGAGYVKYCNLSGMAGWYTRKYDMIVVQFTVNQLLVYKCVFDVLEMTKNMEESYEWNYKHVVGINITGDEEEKDLGGGFALSGTKYLTISAASGEKIRIILGASTKQLVGGKTQRATIGGSERIFSVANSAMTNIRQAIRDKAG